MNEQLNEVRDPIAELEQKCERAERRARICQEIELWAAIFEEIDRVIASCPPERFDA